MNFRFQLVPRAILGLWITASTVTAMALAEEKPASISFKRTQLDTKFRSEGSCVGDFNGDGKLDIGAGSVYYAAPDWKMISVLEKPEEFDPHNYSVSFCNFAEDVNGDGRTDLIVVDFPGKQTWWFEQPEKAGAAVRRGTSARPSRTTKAPATWTSTATASASCCLASIRASTSAMPSPLPRACGS